MQLLRGKSYTKAYRIWAGMKQRCHSPRNPAYSYYGARGITVCDRWLESFDNFHEDMGDPPSTPRSSIERVNNNLGYSKDNCVWATPKIQNNNQSDNIWVTVDGVRQTLSQCCERLGVKYRLVWGRLQRGWSLKNAISRPSGIKERPWRRRNSGLE